MCLYINNINNNRVGNQTYTHKTIINFPEYFLIFSLLIINTRGDKCDNCLNRFEKWFHPNNYKTNKCTDP